MSASPPHAAAVAPSDSSPSSPSPSAPSSPPADGLGHWVNAEGDVFEGDFKDGKLHGLGMRWNAKGQLTGCGRWHCGLLMESRAVPRAKITVGKFLSPAARAAPVDRTLLVPHGGYYIGPINAESLPHGDGGVWYCANGSESKSGEWRDGKLHGRGKMAYTDRGDGYEGEFVSGLPHGLGCRVWADGTVCEGEWAAGKCNGFSVHWDKGGIVIKCGRWADDKLTESCAVPLIKIPVGKFLSAAARSLSAADRARALLLPDGGHYVGDFDAEFQHGEGVAYDADGSEPMRGQWRAGQMHGPGKMTFSNGDVVEGEFVDGRLSGQGTYRWLGGDVYEGQWAQGQRSGLGTYTYADGAAYEGEWAAKQRSGFGTSWNREGKLLQCGRFADDKLTESCAVPRSKIPIGMHLSDAAKLASLLLPDGGFCLGSLNAALRLQGQGSLHCADGTEVVSGEWTDGRLAVSGEKDEAGRLHGLGAQWGMRGLYCGLFVHGQRHGLGSIALFCGGIVEGEWAGGKLSGFGVEWDEGGKMVRCGRWAYGKFLEDSEGPVPLSKIPVGTHLSAAVRSLSASDRQRMLLLPDGGHYIGDFDAEFRQHDKGSACHSHGQPAAAGTWFYGRLDGLGVTWCEDGKINQCGRFEDGELKERCAVPCHLLPADPSGNNYGGASLLRPDGGRYVGPLNARYLPHGDGGVEYGADGSESASGQWRDGQMHGRGNETSPLGDCYEGEFDQGTHSGQGTLRWANGDLYRGQWASGKQSGFGTYRWADGRVYIGDYAQGQHHGLGTFTFAEGGVYEGEWAANKCSGSGAEWDKDGNMILCGQWDDGFRVESCAVPRCKVPIGTHLSAAAKLASVLLPDGGFCLGPLNAALRLHGQGSLHRADGSEAVSGEWADGRLAVSGEKDAEGRLHGEGAEWGPRGLHSGRFEHGQRQGLGVLALFDGHAVEGEWAADKRSGFGVEWDEGGKIVRCGRWDDGNMVEWRPVPRSKIPIGKHLSAAEAGCTLLLPDGGHYIGDVYDERPHGLGTEYYPCGSVSASGEWVDGQLHGFALSWDEHGALKEFGIFDQGKLRRECAVPRDRIPAVEMHNHKAAGADLLLPDGGHYCGDFDAEFRPHGTGTDFYADGSPYASGQWADGKLQGFGLRWHASGRLKECGHFEGGEVKYEINVPCRLLPADPSGNNYGGASLLLPDGGRYVGPLNAQNQPHGDGGVEYRADGSECMSGQWRDGQMHGRGKKIFRHDIYEGEFADSQRHGQGTYSWPNGDVYEGQWTRDQTSGLGRYTYASGSVYEGESTADQRGGFGIEWDKDGKVVACGRWVEHKHVEWRPVPLSKIAVGTHLSATDRPRTLLLPGGKHYIGDFSAEFWQHGQGTLYHAGGFATASGQWAAGQLHGFGLRWDADSGLVLEECGRFNDGVLVESCAVPLRLIPAGPVHDDKDASLLFPDGRFYVGDLNAQHQRHGKGRMHFGGGALEDPNGPGEWRQNRMLGAAEEDAAQGASASSSSSVGPSSSSSSAPPAAPECVACMDAPPNCFTGCGHICMCMGCAAQVDKCPNCREPIIQRTRVFIAYSYIRQQF